MEQNPLSHPLKELAGIDVHVKVVDVGASNLGGITPYAPLLAAGIADVVGFEPNPRALDRLNQLKGPHETYMSSLLQPNPKVLHLFHGLPEWGRVTEEITVNTVRLDDMPETAGLDLLKMDIQGAELMVLRHAEERLKNALVIQTEVEFLPMYVDQPLFSDMDIFLRERGFVLHRFYPTVSRVIKPLIVDNNPLAGLSQLLWADAIFVRDFTRPEVLSNRQLLTMAEILHDCYGSVDLRCSSCMFMIIEMGAGSGGTILTHWSTLSSIYNTKECKSP